MFTVGRARGALTLTGGSGGGGGAFGTGVDCTEAVGCWGVVAVFSGVYRFFRAAFAPAAMTFRCLSKAAFFSRCSLV